MSSPTGRRTVSRTAAAVLTVIAVVIAAAGGYLYTSRHSTSQTSTATTSSTSGRGPLILYVADAYSLEGQTLLSAFSDQTGVPTAPPKAAGSLVLAQQIAQGNPVSVFISVSKSAVQSQYLGNQSSGWAIGFAGDQMILAYTNATLQSPSASATIADSKKASSSNTTQDWNTFFSDLTSGSLKVGISDPNADPAGYRGWIVLEAAGNTYANNSTHFTRRMLSSGINVTGSSAANLIAPLQAGQIQFLFIYKSAATSHGLNYLLLPDTTNLGNPAKSAYYSKFTYTLKTGVQKGAPIVLYITVPRDSTDYTDSVQFTVFTVTNAPTLLKNYGLSIFSTAKLYNSTSVPGQIAQLLKDGSLKYGGTL